ncbi:hypothetical protein GCM10025857_09510 [Alicyclobacillus contaminans]|nr:hypothetical protein GCM10025857_09510 [Alicyclobacillus contaminans]
MSAAAEPVAMTACQQACGQLTQSVRESVSTALRTVLDARAERLQRALDAATEPAASGGSLAEWERVDAWFAKRQPVH